MKYLGNAIVLVTLISSLIQANPAAGDATQVVYTPSYNVEGLPGAVTGNTLAFSGPIANALMKYLKENGNHYVEYGGNNAQATGENIGCGIQNGGAPSCSMGIDEKGQVGFASFLVDALYDPYFDQGLGGPGKAQEQRKNSEITLLANDADFFAVRFAGLAAKVVYDNLDLPGEIAVRETIKSSTEVRCSHRPGERYKYLCSFVVGSKGDVRAER